VIRAKIENIIRGIRTILASSLVSALLGIILIINIDLGTNIISPFNMPEEHVERQCSGQNYYFPILLALALIIVQRTQNISFWVR
jgi:hypothetical protein